MPAELSFSLKQARRLALAAQGFSGRQPPALVKAVQVNRLIERLGVLQIDSVNAVVRSHYLPLSPAWATILLPFLSRRPGARADGARCLSIGGMKPRYCRWRFIH